METSVVAPTFTFNKDEKTVDHFDANYRKVIISIFLSILPGLGQIYCGKLYRGIIAYIGLIVVSWLCAIIFIKVESRLISILVLCSPFIYALGVCLDAAICAIVDANNRVVTNTNRLGLHLLVFLSLFVLINSFMDHMIGKHVVRAYFVTTSSMSPNVLQYDLVVIDKISQAFTGDIVLLDFNNNSNNSSISSIISGQTLRRVIATEGYRVEIRGKTLYINNKLVKEKYAHFGETRTHNIYTSNDYRWGPDTVPDNAYFVLSDARQYGFDSRTFGFITKNHIKGIASKVLWSWNLTKGDFQWGRTASTIKRDTNSDL